MELVTRLEAFGLGILEYRIRGLFTHHIDGSGDEETCALINVRSQETRDKRLRTRDFRERADINNAQAVDAANFELVVDDSHGVCKEGSILHSRERKK